MTTAKVFVGSLPPGCKPEELRHLFTSYGNVVECDIMNRCGFVHLETVEMADAAITALNGVEFKGQNIVVEPGRLKDRRGGGGGGGGGGNAGGGGGAGSNRRPNMQGSNFSRGDHHSGSFRGGRGGGAAGNSRSDIHFGPVRNEGHFRQQRNAPYSKGHNQSYEGSTQGGYKNKFSQGNQGQMSHSDYQSGGGGGGAGSHRGGGFRGQDRRGFALPTVDHHHQQQQQQLGRYGNGGPIGVVPSGSSPRDNGMFQGNRSHSGSTQGGRGGGGFNASRGGFIPRGGGFSANNRRGGGTSSSSHGGSFNNSKHAAANGHHHQHHAPNSYQSEFPPLGSSRNRFNGPRPAPHMGGGGNRRF